MNSLATVLSQQGIQEAAAAAELQLTAEQARSIAQVEGACLERSHRVQFAEGAAASLVRQIGGSSYLAGPQTAQTLEDLVEAFYDLREDLPAHVTDMQIIEQLHKSFEAQAAGDAELAAAAAQDALQAQLREDLAYEIVDDDGKVYSFDPQEWHDDVQAPGWLGERWDQGLDESWNASAWAGERHE